MPRGVFRQNAQTGSVSYRDSLGIGDITKVPERILGPVSDQDFSSDGKETVEALPPIADYGNGTGACLE